ncbi:roadblock/LC7 domain-containing protein [Actinomadura livida]|uniref:Putative regulator of Ras-like GTPase activity (Roadblock/LC7/MglB family) n=1 Tax=Actinomadura livida TaxID=79909 RepID=A0A7W7IIH9_9ACTN|nr:MULTISPECIES: roadblock/LC7 domain-containing protein [Actinomadura]MBB4777333.1 putative regulator of Ras-like GTPase activity (Roadblock/LC7/MglB family) [Actinomadura catellatispora]GGU19976.1 dynein regulation protein LC7 [Actinomadura livida]
MSGVAPNQAQDLAWLLRGLGEEVPVIRGSVLLSADGMLKAAHGFDRTSAEQLSALASGLFSIARSTGAKFDDSNEVRQVVAELRSSQLFISWAGYNSVLAVLAGADADPAVVGFEMARLIRSVRPFLHTAVRPAATAIERDRPI